MSDEFKLNRDVSRAAIAKALLDNELLQEAFAALERDYIAAWRGTQARDSDARERLWQAVQITGKVKDQLTVVLNNGKLAQREIEDIAGRKKRFGLV